MLQKTRDWLFKTAAGEYVVTQRPNRTVLAGVIAWLLREVVEPGGLRDLISVVLLILILFWGTTELISGVNVFRKLIGFVAIVYVILVIVAR